MHNIPEMDLPRAVIEKIFCDVNFPNLSGTIPYTIQSQNNVLNMILSHCIIVKEKYDYDKLPSRDVWLHSKVNLIWN